MSSTIYFGFVFYFVFFFPPFFAEKGGEGHNIYFLLKREDNEAC